MNVPSTAQKYTNLARQYPIYFGATAAVSRYHPFSPFSLLWALLIHSTLSTLSIFLAGGLCFSILSNNERDA